MTEFDPHKIEKMYQADSRRIQRVARKAGVRLTVKEARQFWREHSDQYCAGWLILPADDKYILVVLRDFLLERLGWLRTVEPGIAKQIRNKLKRIK